MADGQAVTKSGIHAATLAVMAEVGVIGKTRTNTGQNYQFRGIDDVVERVGPLQAKHGITMSFRIVEWRCEVVETKGGTKMMHVFVRVEHKYEASDGTFALVETLGESMDSGDKAANKAESAALKYAHVHRYQIPTFGKEADTEASSPELAPKAASAPRSSGAPRAAATSNASPRPAQAAPGGSGVGALFPNYGSKKGMPIAGAALRDLEWYSKNAREAIADPSKAKWRERETLTLAALEAEIRRQSAPGAWSGEPPRDPDEPPPHSDDDAQF